MDKETLSNYGWIVICILVLSIMIALATPFGQYIGNAVKSTTEGLFKVEQKALGAAGLVIGDQSFEDTGGGGTPTPVPVVGSATFSGYYDDDGNYIEEKVTLTWAELQLEGNGTKCGYNASAISDTGIGEYAFEYAPLTSIKIPESVTSIGDGAFGYCYDLTSVTIPNSVTSIGEMAFVDCTSLTSVTIPDSVTSIGECAFSYCTSLTNIKIPDSLTTIGDYAFQGCESLTSIDIPDGVTSIGEGAFHGCKSLTSIDLSRCTNLTSIGNSAFYGCTSLTSIDIPDGVTIIGEGAFWSCKSLTSIDLPDGITSIGQYAFRECTALTSINYAGTMDNWDNITLGEYWKYNVPATVVHCSDGDVSIEYIAPVAI